MHVEKIKLKMKEKADDSREMLTIMKMKIDVKGYKTEISDLIQEIYDAIYKRNK